MCGRVRPGVANSFSPKAISANTVLLEAPVVTGRLYTVDQGSPTPDQNQWPSTSPFGTGPQWATVKKITF